MNDKKVIALLNKLTTWTKNNTIEWVDFPSSKEKMKTLSNEEEYINPFSTSALEQNNLLRYSNLKQNLSYACRLDGGNAYLLYKSDSVLTEQIELVLQTDESKTSRLCASTSTANNSEILSQLKRLYNLAKTYAVTDIDLFIDKIIESE